MTQWLHNNSVGTELRCRCSWAQMSATPKHKYKSSLMCFTLIVSNIVLHKTSLRLSSLNHVSASSLAFHGIALEFFSGGFCPFYAHCSPCSTVQHCWSAAAAEWEDLRPKGKTNSLLHKRLLLNYKLSRTGRLAEINRKKGAATAKVSGPQAITTGSGTPEVIFNELKLEQEQQVCVESKSRVIFCVVSLKPTS